MMSSLNSMKSLGEQSGDIHLLFSYEAILEIFSREKDGEVST